jgi:hypothetical protein
MQSCDHDLSIGRLSYVQERRQMVIMQEDREWRWVELTISCMLAVCKKKQIESIMRKGKQESMLRQTCFMQHARTTKRPKKTDKVGDPPHVFPSVGSRRLRPGLASFDFDAVNGAVDEMSHLLRC